jgi:hypothetical protein
MDADPMRLSMHDVPAIAMRLALAASATWPAWAAGQTPVAHYWYDGGQRRPLYLDPARVADFELPGHLILKATSVAGTSPVFHDGPGSDGAPRALPGGMLVKLKPPMDDDPARAWFAARGLVAVRRIGGTATWLVKTEPGMASLRAANQLHESGEVAAAEPNWWLRRTLK